MQLGCSGGHGSLGGKVKGKVQGGDVVRVTADGVLLCVVLWGKRARSARRYPPNGV